MMVKPSGCCDRNGVSPYGTPRPVIPLDARLSTRLRCDKGQRCDKQRYVIELGRTLSRAPHVCDYHVRSRTSESQAATEEL
jgi:hypothetical protein